MKKIFFIPLLIFCIVGCRTSSIVSHHDSSYKSSNQLQTTTRVDSITIDRWHTVQVCGDTVYRVDSIIKNKIQRITDTIKVADTIKTTQCDTVYKTIEKSVERKAVAWQIAGFWILLAGVIAAVILRIKRG